MTKTTAILWSDWPPTDENKWKKKKMKFQFSAKLPSCVYLHSRWTVGVGLKNWTHHLSPYYVPVNQTNSHLAHGCVCVYCQTWGKGCYSGFWPQVLSQILCLISTFFGRRLCAGKSMVVVVWLWISLSSKEHGPENTQGGNVIVMLYSLSSDISALISFVVCMSIYILSFSSLSLARERDSSFEASHTEIINTYALINN